MNLSGKSAALDEILRAHAPLLVAFSGGVDSAFLLAAAHRAVGDQVTGIIADSPSLPRRALADAIALAAQIGTAVDVVKTSELANPEYASNPVNRCYFCKVELFSTLDRLARTRGFRALAYGENADDMRQVRPGRRAAEEFAVIAPLRDAGLTKTDIRELSRLLGLPTADAPSQPCLSSRIPHGTSVTVEALALVERGEALVRSLGFRVFRVRHLESAGVTRARVQISPDEMTLLPDVHPRLEAGLRAVGYDAVEIDLAGYRAPS